MGYNQKSLESILKKYKCKARLFILVTPSYKDNEYIKIKNYYNDNAYEFHKYYVKKITILNNELKNPTIQLYDLDSKQILSNKNPKKILNKIKTYEKETSCKLKPLNLSLYSDYNPDTTTPNLGFKNKDKALYTIKKIKNRSIKYQLGVLNTLLGRAKSHPHKTKDMDEAIKILEEYKKKLKPKE
tara:strand:- start:1269 stop:1823 length:555 start_codon:yes stop_codon:yes gene_type:complete